jgi:hypothetical protein
MLKRVSLILKLLLLLCFITSCKCKKLTTDSEQIIETANEGMIVEQNYNNNKTYLLITCYKNDLTSRKIIDYKVLNASDKKIVKSGKFEGTKLVWYSNDSLIGYLHVGMIKKDNDDILVDNNKLSKENSIIIEIK